MAIHSSILAGEAHGQRSLADYSLWGHKELDTTERRTLLLFFRFYSHVGHCRILSRVPFAIQQVLFSYLFYLNVF